MAADKESPALPWRRPLQNSPCQIEALEESSRPIILLSTSGTRLIAEAVRHGVTYVGCLRNAAALATHLAGQERDVLILGADSRGEFREEDQLCAARIARALLESGSTVADNPTEEVVTRWGDAPDDAFVEGRSARYLRDTGQQADLAFVLEHVDDLSAVFVVEQGEVRGLEAA